MLPFGENWSLRLDKEKEAGPLKSFVDGEKLCTLTVI